MNLLFWSAVGLNGAAVFVFLALALWRPLVAIRLGYRVWRVFSV